MTTSPNRDSVSTSSPTWYRQLRWLSLPVLTGMLLATIARPVFRQEEAYLTERSSPRRQDDRQGPSVTVNRSSASRQERELDQTIRVGRRPAPSTDNLFEPRFQRGDRPAAIPTNPDRPSTLRLSRGFAQGGGPAPIAPPPAAAPDEAAPPSFAGPAPGSDALTLALAALLAPPDTSLLTSEAPPPLTGAIPGPATPPLAATPAPAAPPVTRAERQPLPLPSIPDQPSAIASPPDVPLPTFTPPVASSPAPDGTLSGLTAPLPWFDLEDPEAIATDDAPVDDPRQTVSIPDQVLVTEFVVTGSTVFAPEDLAAIALTAAQGLTADSGTAESSDEGLCQIQGPLILAEPITLTPSQLIRASDAIEQCYINRNFISSGAFIAPTELTDADGTVEITVVEGSLEAINVNVARAGLFGLNPNYVRSRLSATIGDPFNLDDLVEAVRLLELDPLINQISTEIVPGSETGTSVLNANVVPDDGFDVSLFIDNERSPSVGSLRRGITVSQANLLGLGDRLSLGYNITGGSDEFSLGYTVPINARNGTVGFNFTTTDSEVIEEPFSILDIVSDSTTYEIFYRQPLILTSTQEFALSLRGTRRNSQAEFLEGIAGDPIPFPGVGADADGRVEITALRFGQEWIARNSQQVIALLSEFSFGLGALGATIQPIPPDSRFFLWRGQGQWVRRLGPESLFILRGNVQLADRPLLANEQFSFGGQRAGRGYRLNTLLRDNGWFLSGEFRVPLFRVPKGNLLLQAAPFFDVGGGWNRGDAPDTLFLTSTGLGLIFDVDDHFSARLDVGFPLSDFDTTGTNLQDSGIHFSIRVTP